MDISCVYYSPVGALIIVEKEEKIVRINFSNKKNTAPKTPLLKEAVLQLKAYFSGDLQKFDLPLNPEGTPFRKAVWHQLLQIPYGETRSYKDIANALHKPNACRAIGGANHHNPIPIIIPCHRVIGADGSLTGYGGGMDKKQYLLLLEQQNFN